MDDECVIVLTSGSDEDVTNKRKCMAPVVVEETASSTEEDHQISGGLNGVSSVTAVVDDSRVIFEESDSQSITSNKRPKINNQIDACFNDDMKKEDVADLGTRMEFVLVSDGEKLQDYNERRGTSRIEDVETGKATHVAEHAESMTVVEISSISEEEEETVHFNNSNVDEVILLTPPVLQVDDLAEGEHSDTVQASRTDKKQDDGEKSIRMLVMSGTDLVLENSNSVMRKLLRGPRYFNRLDGESEMCRNCGEEGHSSVMCTSKQRSKPCFVCGGLGHSGRKCIKGQVCFHCEGVGHASENCPNRNEEQFLISCLRCGDLGHDIWKCINDFPQDDLKKIQCYICKNFGHLCCVGFPDLGSRQLSCWNCGCSGHVGSECKKKTCTGKYVPYRKHGSQDRGGRRKKYLQVATEKTAKAARAAKAAEAAKAAQAIRAAKAERAFIAESAAIAQRAAKAERVAKAAEAVKAAKAAKAAKAEKAAKAAEAAKAAKVAKAATAEKAITADRGTIATRVAKTEKADIAQGAAKAAKTHIKEVKKIFGSKSAPHNLYRPQKKIKTSHAVRPGAGALLPRSRDGPSDIRSNFSDLVPGSMVWRVPEPSSEPYIDQTPPYFCPDFLNPQNPFQTLYHPSFSRNSYEGYPSSSYVPYTGPRNLTQMSDHFGSPVAHPYQSTQTNYPRIATPYPPTLVFNRQPVPPSQAYFPVGSNQADASLYAPRNYPNPQNPVQRFTHPTAPPYQLRFQSPWPGHY